MPNPHSLFRNRLGLPGLDHALLVALVAVLLLGLSDRVRASLAALAEVIPQVIPPALF